MDHWSIDFWITEDNVCRVERELKSIKRDKYLYASLEEKMKKYVQEPITHTQNLKYLEKVKSEENMWELKFHLYQRNEIRFLGCLTEKAGYNTFYALYAFKKKDQKIKNEHRETARKRVNEFISFLIQNKKDELQRIL